MRGQGLHGVMPEESQDEIARQEFVTSLKIKVLEDLAPANKKIFEKRVLSRIQRGDKKEKINPKIIAQSMNNEPFWQMWSSLNRSSQEMMWDALGARIERQLPTLAEKALTIVAGRKVRGSIQVRQSFQMPRYNSAIDIHCQPGGYHTEIMDNDVYAGALYDTGAYQYGMGGQGPMSDDVGVTAGRYLKKSFPNFNPARILDLGCGVGHQTLGLLGEFPEAEMHACDLGKPMLLYGLARAESLKKHVHFKQQNAERMEYNDASFDLVSSLILLHETSAKAVPNIFAECYRLLKPGGIMLHGDIPELNKYWPDAYDQFQRNWTTHYNAEPFRSRLREMDLTETAKKVGFSSKNISEDLILSAFGHAGNDRTSLYGRTHAYGMKWWVLVAQK